VALDEVMPVHASVTEAVEAVAREAAARRRLLGRGPRATWTC
jgi:hypothetical protein